MPGATQNRDIRKAVNEAEEDQTHNENIKESEDFSDNGLGSVHSSTNMDDSQQQIVGMEDDDFASEDDKVSSCPLKCL